MMSSSVDVIIYFLSHIIPSNILESNIKSRKKAYFSYGIDLLHTIWVAAYKAVFRPTSITTIVAGPYLVSYHFVFFIQFEIRAVVCCSSSCSVFIFPTDILHFTLYIICKHLYHLLEASKILLGAIFPPSPFIFCFCRLYE